MAPVWKWGMHGNNRVGTGEGGIYGNRVRSSRAWDVQDNKVGLRVPDMCHM